MEGDSFEISKEKEFGEINGDLNERNVYGQVFN